MSYSTLKTNETWTTVTPKKGPLLTLQWKLKALSKTWMTLKCPRRHLDDTKVSWILIIKKNLLYQLIGSSLKIWSLTNKIVKSVSKHNYKTDRELLNEEIIELHKDETNSNKKDWNFNSNFGDHDSNHKLERNRVDDRNIQRYNDDFITMKQIPELN